MNIELERHGSVSQFAYAIIRLQPAGHADFENAFPYIRVQNLTLDPATAVDLLASGDSRDPRDGLQPREAREKLTFKMELLTLVRPNAL